MITVYLTNGEYLELKNVAEEKGWVYGNYKDGEGRVDIPVQSILYVEDIYE